MDSSPQDPGRRTPGRADPGSPRVTRLVEARTMDAELAALLWLMVESHVPLLVTAPEADPVARATLGAFLDLVPPPTTRLELQGERESFDWLADAASLGWPAESAAVRADSVASASPPRRVAPPETTYLVAGELGCRPPADTWGLRARTVVRALQRGYGLGAVVRAGSLAGVLEQLSEAPTALTSDELRRIGVVVVLRRDGREMDVRPGGDQGAGDGPAATTDASGWRVAACHYVRPLERDAAGHLQRRPPAILATWDAERDAYEHFAWGVTAELAMRAGYPRDEFEREHLARTRMIAALVASGRTSETAAQDLPSRRPQRHADRES